MVTSIVVTENEYEKGREIFQQLKPGYQIITSDSDEKTLAENISHTGACPSSKHLGRLSLFCNRGSGSSWFDVKPLCVDGSSGVFGWSVS